VRAAAWAMSMVVRLVVRCFLRRRFAGCRQRVDPAYQPL
jgi:hypothetical protein